jgi:thiol-disulfide isomerase/thioredoxin
MGGFMQKIHGLHLLFILVMCLSNPAFGQPPTWSDWQHGARGHAQALSSAERAMEPMVVYFHTEWCPWCRKLNERYLRNGQVRDVLSGMQKVEINPETDSAGKALFSKYGGKGYPSFHVLVPGSGEPTKKISPFRRTSEQSLAEFSDVIRKSVTTQYNRWAHRLAQANDHARALQVLDKSLSYDPYNGYAHYMQGLIHHKQGHEQRDVELLRKAKLAYERALSIEPGHKGSQQGLDALRNL